MLASPVKRPQPSMTAITRSPRIDGRTTSIAPVSTTRNGTSVWPGSISTSPRVIGRRRPCAATRDIWAALSTGNISAASGALVSGGAPSIGVDIGSLPLADAIVDELAAGGGVQEPRIEMVRMGVRLDRDDRDARARQDVDDVRHPSAHDAADGNEPE